MRQNNVKNKIKEHFLLNPTSKLRLREIERALDLSLPSVIRYSKELKLEGILDTIQTGDVIFYTADKTNENYLLEKRLFNLKQITTCGLISYLRKKLSNPPIVLFGSFAKGEDIERSDVDIYVETVAKADIDIKKFEKKLHRKIQIFRNTSLNELPPNLANNVTNGITLNNQVEVFK